MPDGGGGGSEENEGGRIEKLGGGIVYLPSSVSDPHFGSDFIYMCINTLKPPYCSI